MSATVMQDARPAPVATRPPAVQPAGSGSAYEVCRLIHVPYVLPGIAMPVGFGVSALVGVAFAVAPARKAARLNPLAALRYE